MSRHRSRSSLAVTKQEKFPRLLSIDGIFFAAENGNIAIPNHYISVFPAN
jgi:hypothetical protein